MPLKVIGAGVGRTGTNSLKLALEQLLGGRCHHMFEIISDPSQVPGWTDALEGREVDWQQLLAGYVAQVDWPARRSGANCPLRTPMRSWCSRPVTPRIGTAARPTRSSRFYPTHQRDSRGGSRR